MLSTILYHRNDIKAIHNSEEGTREIDGELTLTCEDSNYFLSWTPYNENSFVKSTKIELTDLASCSFDQIGSNLRVTFVCTDGSTPPSLLLDPIKDWEQFFDYLNSFFQITRLEKKNHLILHRNKEDSLIKSFDELHLFQDSKQTFAKSFFVGPTSNYNPLKKLYSGFSEIWDYSSREYIPDHIHSTVIKHLNTFNARDFRSSTDCESDFEIVSKLPILPEPLKDIKREQPLTFDEWKMAQDENGRIMNFDFIKKRIFHGSIEPNLRKVVWKYLLSYLQWDNTNEQNAQLMEAKRSEYYTMKNQWKTMTLAQEKRNKLFVERKSLLEKDVLRTDRNMEFYSDDLTESDSNLSKLYDILMTYCVYNGDLGYVQGMNDLLAVIFHVLRDEVDSFWCFANLMDKMIGVFDAQLSVIKKQFSQLFSILEIVDYPLSVHLVKNDAKSLFFTFRWLLLLFKREFSYDNVKIIWETVWSEHLAGEYFHLFIAASILINYRDTIVSNKFRLNEILKFVNDKSMRIDLNSNLIGAQIIYHQISAAINHPNNYIPDEVKELIMRSKKEEGI